MVGALPAVCCFLRRGNVIRDGLPDEHDRSMVRVCPATRSCGGAVAFVYSLVPHCKRTIAPTTRSAWFAAALFPWITWLFITFHLTTCLLPPFLANLFAVLLGYFFVYDTPWTSEQQPGLVPDERGLTVCLPCAYATVHVTPQWSCHSYRVTLRFRA